MTRMTYDQLIAEFGAKEKRLRYKLKKYGTVLEVGRKYGLYKIVINPRCRRTLLIVSGFHGEEFNGPISLVHIFDEAARYARRRGVRLIVYPCINPSGFDLHKRYNASDEIQNNDFLRYQLPDGSWVGTLQKDEEEKFVAFEIVDSKAKEVRLLKRDVLKYRVPAGALDIHQQKGNLDTGDFYAYIFDLRPVYKKIMNKLKKFAKVARNDPAMNFEDGREVYYKIDNDGFVVIRDGTLTDMLHRLGTKYAVAAETNTTLPLETVCRINLTWIKEMIKLIAKK